MRGRRDPHRPDHDHERVDPSARPAPAPAAMILQLQQGAGNAAVAQMLGRAYNNTAVEEEEALAEQETPAEDGAAPPVEQDAAPPPAQQQQQDAAPPPAQQQAAAAPPAQQAAAAAPPAQQQDAAAPPAQQAASGPSGSGRRRRRYKWLLKASPQYKYENLSDEEIAAEGLKAPRRHAVDARRGALDTAAKAKAKAAQLEAQLAAIDPADVAALQAKQQEIADLRAEAQAQEIGIDRLGLNMDEAVLRSFKVKYLATEDERKPYEVTPDGGKLVYKHHPERAAVDTTGKYAYSVRDDWCMFVMSQEGRMFVGEHRIQRFHHASFLVHEVLKKGKMRLMADAVAMAGMIQVVDGVVKAISNKSGHFRGGSYEMLQFLHELHVNGVPLSGVKLSLIGEWKLKDGRPATDAGDYYADYKSDVSVIEEDDAPAPASPALAAAVAQHAPAPQDVALVTQAVVQQVVADGIPPQQAAQVVQQVVAQAAPGSAYNNERAQPAATPDAYNNEKAQPAATPDAYNNEAVKEVRQAAAAAAPKPAEAAQAPAPAAAPGKGRKASKGPLGLVRRVGSMIAGAVESAVKQRFKRPGRRR